MHLKEIREQSLQYIRKWKLLENPNLPLLDEVDALLSIGSRTQRILCMHAAAAVAYGFPRDSVIRWIEKESLEAALAGSEKRFIYDQLGEKGQFQTQIEAMWSIAWTLGIVKLLDYRKNCDQSFVGLLPDLRKMETSERFVKAVNDRSVDEVLKLADLAYCLHWSLSQSALSGKNLAWPVQNYVIIQRRKGLDWSIGEDVWDEVPLDT